jgi:hypothetical protein
MRPGARSDRPLDSATNGVTAVGDFAQVEDGAAAVVLRPLQARRGDPEAAGAAQAQIGPRGSLNGPVDEGRIPVFVEDAQDTATASLLVSSTLLLGPIKGPCGLPPSRGCIDVRSLGRFRTRVTDDHVKGGRIDLWHLEIVCLKGAIYPHGGTLLQAYTARSRTRNLLKALPCVRVHQDGDSETTVVFDVRDFAWVAEVMRPRKKRPAPTWMLLGRVSR